MTSDTVRGPGPHVSHRSRQAKNDRVLDRLSAAEPKWQALIRDPHASIADSTMVSKSRRSAYLGLIVVDVIRAETIKPEFRMHSRPIRANRYRVPESDRDPADGENGIAAEYHSSLVRTLRTIFEVSIDR
ncbi:hypothetical protein [Amycolatopsis thailandensis]|uniref:hypothetical protein n=1 Tax=Amycolatopsis thailandensis TaxID=589330 RepID=UPI003642F87F